MPGQSPKSDVLIESVASPPLERTKQLQRRQLQQARELVLAHGWNVTAYQILNPGIRLWFSARGDAVVGFVRQQGVCVVAGAPICAEERLPDVLAEWEATVKRAGDSLCYFGAGDRLEAFLRSQGRATVLLGAQPTWHPGHWAALIKKHSSLRAQLNRARNKGVIVEQWPIERARNHPALQRCLSQWLRTRNLPPLHFLVETNVLARLFDRQVWVARKGEEVLGFCVLSPVPARRGWLIEHIIRGSAAPNGMAELMVDHAIRHLAADSCEYVTMGLTPLSHMESYQQPEQALWLQLALTWVRAHGRRFYNFDGLENFKAKFRPEEWEPIYAITGNSHFAPNTLYAIAAAFSAGSPVQLMIRSCTKAVRQEARWMAQRWQEKQNQGA